MTLRHLISLSLLLTALAAGAQSAGDYFDGGAQLYISNNIPAALDKTEKGLKSYPDDAKLKKLEELLKQQQQSQSQQNQQNQQNQSKQNQSQQNQAQQQQSQQDQKNQQNQQQQNQQQNQQSQSGQQQKAQQQAQQQAGQQKAAQANMMTPEDAKRLLDSQKDNEQYLQIAPTGKPPPENQTIKDW